MGVGVGLSEVGGVCEWLCGRLVCPGGIGGMNGMGGSWEGMEEEGKENREWGAKDGMGKED